jgi:methylglyoxal synthase
MEVTSTASSPRRRTIALIAHDAKKDGLVDFAVKHREVLSKLTIIATGTTGMRIKVATGEWRGLVWVMAQSHHSLYIQTAQSAPAGLDVECLLSGPLGGDAQIAARVATGACHAVIFIIDPLSAHPHEPDVQALLLIEWHI